MESHKMIRIIIIWLIINTISAFTLCLIVDEIYTKSGIELYTFKVKENEHLSLFERLYAYNFTLRNQITPSTFIFEYTGSRRNKSLRRMIAKVKRIYTNKIQAVERVREYDDTLKPVAAEMEETVENLIPDRKFYTNLVCDHYYGMGVEKAWSRGYSGSGVTVAITDVGVNTELRDLNENIDASLSYNFVDDNKNVRPEFYHNFRQKASQLTDHGNKVASIISATKGNNLCSAGIAYNSTIIVLKIYKVRLFNNHIPTIEPSHWTRSDIISRALVYKLDTIDIFANAWAPTQPFDMLDMATRDAIRDGASNGRYGLGTIHVVPSGPPGNELSNNIYTITVNSIGRHGTIPDYTYIDASVLTSGLGDGNNLTSASMVTTTLKNRCITGFNGVSAATAQIAGIIPLALEANKYLSLRDIQHLLVHASDHKQLHKEKIAFVKNAAGRHFHGVFGFGLLDADELVTRALKQAPTPPLQIRTLGTYITRTSSHITRQIFEFCHICDNPNRQNCLTTIEHIQLTMNLKTSTDELKIAIESPGGTLSVLMDFHSKRGKLLNVKLLKLVSVHFWDEVAFGPWRLHVQDGHYASRSKINKISLTLYGTADPIKARFEQQYSDMCRENRGSGNGTSTTSSSHLTSPLVISSKPKENTKGSSDQNALVALPVFMVVIVFLYIYYKRYRVPILTFCPTRYGSVPAEDDTNT